MGLNSISLPPFVVAQLYPGSLVGDIEKVKEAKTPLPDAGTNWKFLGSNRAQVLIAVDYEGISHLPDRQLDFLLQLLSACQLSLNDVALINQRNYANVAYDEILTHFNTKTILLFGMTAQEFGFPFETPPYQVQPFANYTVIHAAALQHLEKDRPSKSLLWAGLKKMFKI